MSKQGALRAAPRSKPFGISYLTEHPWRVRTLQQNTKWFATEAERDRAIPEFAVRYGNVKPVQAKNSNQASPAYPGADSLRPAPGRSLPNSPGTS